MREDRLAISHISGPALNDVDPVAVLLHGFTQNRHSWGSFADALGRRFTVLGVDLPGHGDSAANDASFRLSVSLVGDTLNSVDRPVDTLIGYSMGGRIALRLVLERPDVCSRLVVLGATAGLASDGDRKQRREADAALAARLRAEGPEQFLDFWLKLPLFADLPRSQQFKAERLAHWGSGVAETLEYRGTGNMEPFWAQLSAVTLPVLALAGEQDEKFTKLGRAIAEHVGDNGTFMPIAGCGHACHLQRPDETADAILRWCVGS